MMEDTRIIELFFERDQQAIQELDTKYGKVCHKLSYNIEIIDLMRRNASTTLTSLDKGTQSFVVCDG